MKIAFTAQGTDLQAKMDPRFGRTPYILILDSETDLIDVIDNRDMAEEGHGAGPKTSQRMLEGNASILITGNGPGGNAATVLNNKGIKVYVGAGDLTVAEAYESYKKNELKSF